MTQARRGTPHLLQRWDDTAAALSKMEEAQG
jgi:hypothetical protein